MAVVYVPGVAQVRLLWNMSGQPGVNVLHYLRSSSATVWTQADLQSLVDVHMSSFLGGGPGLIPTSTTLTGCDGADLSNVGIPAVAVSGHAPVVGTRAGVALPPNNAVNMGLKTGARYRGGHGRTYFPGGTSSDLGVTSNQWASAYLTAWQGQWTSMQSTLHSFITGVQQIIIHWLYEVTVDSTTGKVTRKKVGVQLLDPVVGYVGNPIIGSQRNRLRS